MNSLAETFGNSIAVLGFPCNQFGHQTNEGNGDILNTLKHVRPGNGFVPATGVNLFEKCLVNGSDAHPLFQYLKATLPVPVEEDGSASDVLVLPRASYGGTTVALWTPVMRSDVAWNFEKFLVDAKGEPVKRYSRYYDTNKIADDINGLLSS